MYIGQRLLLPQASLKLRVVASGAIAIGPKIRVGLPQHEAQKAFEFK
jgi:hypothetical protein